MAILRLRRALVEAGVISAVVAVPARPSLPSMVARPSRPAELAGYDAVLGVDGAGREMAAHAGLPFIELVKALYAGVLPNENVLVRALLVRSLVIEMTGAREADAVVAPSHFAAASVIREYGADPAVVHVVPEPFDVDEWRGSLPPRARDGTRVLCVAHLYPRKRVLDLLAAWPLVRAMRPDARLDIVGNGPELRALERRARYLDGCYLHGFVPPEAAPQFYARADSFCLPSAQETFGYAAVEAMASGLPVVGADAGAMPEVTSGATARLVPPGSPRELAGAVLWSLEPDVRAEAAHRNPERTRDFDPAFVATALLRIVNAAAADAQRRDSGSSALRSGEARNSSIAARTLSLLAARESAKKPPS
ncbi:MAG: glycosyltransferase family 4 protein [Candidatus Dormibacteraeota bacterium]|nr:glycosyltransferase family 4 protein [Candidatus Dormibacteraeota bacterium]